MMTSAQWQRVQEAFHHALDLPTPERNAYLADLGKEDEALRKQVERLLYADSTASALLDLEPGELAAAVLEDEAETLDHGERIGPYRILRELGRGGMGAVYLAERADGHFTKQVALKLVKRGLDTDEILRRFRYEREILARLEHPHIARLLDGGATDDGRPYLVMEYVEGERLDAYCDAGKLSVEERLRLFRTVCETVQYAHQNLVIHRDLKPANILVTESGHVKLLDFGIAKLVDEDAGDVSALHTRAGVRVMTPEYASPEQLRGEPITTATDVFTLGVVLYELLTGQRPFKRSVAPSQGPHPDPMLDPAAPSTAVTKPVFRSRNGKSASIDPDTISAARATTTRHLQRRLQGDLDTMLLKALRQDPAERYATAEAFLEDINRHLEGLPVTAQRASAAYRLRKYARRHRAGLAVAAAFVLLLVGFGTVYTVRVTQERNRAQRELAEKEAVTAFLVDLFGGADPSEARGDTLTAFDLLERGAAHYETELADQPGVQGQILHILSHVYGSLGDSERELVYARRALEIRQTLFGSQHAAVAESENQLGRALERSGALADAEPHYRTALDLRRRLHAPESKEIAESLSNLGMVLSNLGRYDEARPLMQEALAIDRKLHGNVHEDVATALNNLAVLHYFSGDYEASGAAFREALDIRRKVYGEPHPRVAVTINNLAAVLRRTGALDESETLFREALDMTTAVHGTRHPDIPSTLSNLAAVILDLGRTDEALPLLQEAVDVGRDVYAEHPYQADALANLGRALLELDQHDAAEQAFQESLQINRVTRGEAHPRVALAIYYLGMVARDRGNRASAENYFREALTLQEQVLPEGHDEIAFTRRDLALLLLAGADSTLEPTSRSEAETLLLRAYEALVAAYGRDDARVVELRQQLDAVRPPLAPVEVVGS